MRNMYRVVLCSSVASAALALAAPVALAQTVVSQNSTNNSPVSNPATGTNTIDLGGGGLGVGASVSTSAGGAVSSTSVTGINSQFINPTGGFGTVTQGASNLPGATITNKGAIIGASGDAASGSSLSVNARGALTSFSIIAVGGIPFVPVATVGDISQGFLPPGGTFPVVNVGSISNTGEITSVAGGPALDLSGMGASASISATGAQSSVALSVSGGTAFTGTTFGAISQAPSNNMDQNAVFGVRNLLSSGGVSLGAISGDGAGVSVAATGSAASIALSYINTTTWSPTQITSIFQNPTNNSASVINVPDLNGGSVSVGAISGAGASVRIGATGAVAGVSYSSIGSTAAVSAQGQTLGNVGQVVNNSGGVTNSGSLTATGLTGAGSSAGINALGAGASFSVSSIGDVTSAPLTSPNAGQGFPVFQQVTNTGATGVTNGGQIDLGTGALANGASASISATGAQAAISVGAINTGSFASPQFGVVTQTATNGGVGALTPVTNIAPSITTGNLSGHASSVSASATGAAAGVGISFVNTPAWTSFPLGPVSQTATNNGAVTNGGTTINAVLQPASISVGSISGTGASVRASATGAAASISVTSILSGPPAVNTFGSPGMVQTATNTGAIINNASIVSTGTLSGMASSASINAIGAATSVAIASINDTAVIPPPTATITSINQTSLNNLASPVTNTGSITLAGGNLGAAAAASISAVGASASVSFLAVR